MKIIRVDSFNREGPGYDDVLMAENVKAEFAYRIVTALNQTSTFYSHEFFRAVPDDYKLKVFEP